MKTRRGLLPELVSLVLLVLRLSPLVKSESSLRDQLSPIKSFGPSWAASAAHGTTVAVHCTLSLRNDLDDKTDAIILVLRYTKPGPATPWETNRTPQTQTITDTELQRTIDGLKITGPVHHCADSFLLSTSGVTANPNRWVFLGTTALCSMTGLASDVDYLISILQSQVEDHRYIYDGASAARTSALPTSQILETLANILQKETLYDGQRPLGVQVLLVGRDEKPIGGGTPSAAHRKSPPATFKLFTFDPSGGYRHWGVGTAIGRNAAEVRKQLREQLSSTGTVNGKIGVTTLEACLRSCIEARRGEVAASGESVDQYDVLLLWEEDEQFCAASIDPEQVEHMRSRILSDLNDSG